MRYLIAALTGAALVFSGCKTVSDDVQTQGGIEWKSMSVDPGVTFEDISTVCWPIDADIHQRVILHIADNGKIFWDATEGATNSTARCLREIASAYIASGRKMTGDVALGPAFGRVDGWAVLAWAKLLSSGRTTEARGIMDGAPLVQSCAQKGMGLQATSVFQVTHTPVTEAHVLGGATSDTERCIEAVLGAMTWPTTREFTFAFGPKPQVIASGDVSFYVAPKEGSAGVIDPVKIKEAMGLLKSVVSQCWDQALVRRAGLTGGRTFRFRVEAGHVSQAWVAGNASDTQATANDYLLDACLNSALKTANFEGASGEGLYSWVFATR